jgi:hypothetical protein
MTGKRVYWREGDDLRWSEAVDFVVINADVFAIVARGDRLVTVSLSALFLETHPDVVASNERERQRAESAA